MFGLPLLSSVLLVVCVLIFVAGFGENFRREFVTWRRRRRHPDEPWHWRADWSQKRVTSSDLALAVAFGVVALVVNVVVALVFDPFSLGLSPLGAGLRVWPHEWLFPLLGGLLLVASGSLFVRYFRWGRSTLVLADVPIRPDESLSATLECRIPSAAGAGIQTRLSCVRRDRVLRSGSFRVVSTTLFKLEDTVAVTSLQSDGQRSRLALSIPLAGRVPADLPDSEVHHVVWTLDVSIRSDDVDYSAEFEVPVFRRQGR